MVLVLIRWKLLCVCVCLDQEYNIIYIKLNQCVCCVLCVCMSLLKWVHYISLSYRILVFTERRRAQAAPDPVSVAAARWESFRAGSYTAYAHSHSDESQALYAPWPIRDATRNGGYWGVNWRGKEVEYRNRHEYQINSTAVTKGQILRLCNSL